MWGFLSQNGGALLGGAFCKYSAIQHYQAHFMHPLPSLYGKLFPLTPPWMHMHYTKSAICHFKFPRQPALIPQCGLFVHTSPCFHVHVAKQKCWYKRPSVFTKWHRHFYFEETSRNDSPARPGPIRLEWSFKALNFTDKVCFLKLGFATEPLFKLASFAFQIWAYIFL